MLRARPKRALADKAIDAGVRQIHVTMATEYESLAHDAVASVLSRQAVE